MNKIDRLLRALFLYQDITHGGSLYLRRFLLTPQIFGWRLMLHRLCRPDLDRVLHDHPWDFATFCLHGGYIELVLKPDGIKQEVLRAGQVRLRAAEHTHRIDTLFSNECWTLVLHGPRFRTWGFWEGLENKGTFTEAKTYFKVGYDAATPPRRSWT